MAEENSGNGRVTIREVYDLLDKVYSRINTVASLADKAHDESMEAIADVDKKLDEHLKEANVRDRRIDRMEDWRETQEELAESRVTETVRRLHTPQHNEHMEKYIHFTPEQYALIRKDCMADAEHMFSKREEELGTSISRIDKKVWAMWGVGIFVLSIAGNAVLLLLLGLLPGAAAK